MSLLCAVLVVPTVSASNTSSGEALDAAKGYFNSYISRDIEGMMKHSIDTNYLNEPSRKLAYEENAKTDTVTSYKIINSEKVSDTEVDLSVEYTYSDTGTIPPLPYSVIKKEDGWKVLLKPIEINLNEDSVDYGEVTEGTPAYEVDYLDGNSTSVSPLVTTLDYYSFYNWNGHDLVGADTFNISQTWVSIQGTQYDHNANSTGLTIKYEIITNNNNVVRYYGHATVPGSNPTSNYYKTIQLTQSPISNARVRISSGDAFTANGSGNVYQN